MDSYLIVAGDFAEHGGMDRANLELARYVASLGHPVHLVAHRIAGNLELLENVRTHCVPRPFGFGLAGERCLDLFGRTLAARLPPRTRIVVNGGNCALDAANWVHFVHRIAASAAVDTTRRGRALRALAKWSEERALERARLVIANSEATRVGLLTSFSNLAVPILTVYCGIDAERFYPTEEYPPAPTTITGLSPSRRRLVFVGALGDERKGFETLFDAWCVIENQWPEFELVVVGAGRMLPTLRRRTEQAKLSKRVQFLGARTDVPEILRSSDLLVAPSSYEPYGLNIVEALSTGLPVIASSGSGACEHLRGVLRDLLLDDPHSVVELLTKLRLWRREEKHYRAAALKESSRLRQYSWNAMSATIYRAVEAAFAQ